MHSQQQLGQPTAFEVVGCSMKWTWERGWEASVHGRRSGTDVWLRANLGPATAEATVALLVGVLENRGQALRDDRLEF